MPWLLAFYAFAIGAIVGSFLNVVIHRYPREESIAFPPSHCPNCLARIKPYDNIPILSYLILLGRCRYCRQPISIRYPLVELANALFYLAVFQRMGPTVAFVLVSATISMTIALIFIDLEIQILPDVIDIPGIAIGLGIGYLALGDVENGLILSASLRDSLIGAAVGAGLLLAIGLTYRLVRRIEGMGLGDVKMLAMIGAILGWRPLFSVVLVAAVTGAITGLAIAVRQRKSDLRFALPFGVFLGFAYLTVLLFGNELFEWLPSLALRP